MGETTSRAYRDVLAIPGARALIGASVASQIGNWLRAAADISLDSAVGVARLPDNLRAASAKMQATALAHRLATST